MNLRRNALTASLIITFAVSATAQNTEYSFSTIDIFNGLSNNQVNSIYKDSKGFMWFGTKAGLNRYDGYNFRVFMHDAADSSSLSDDLVSEITEAPGRKLFIKTRNGINIYDQLTEKFTNIQDYLHQLKLPGENLQNIIKTSDIFIFIFSNDLYKYTNGRITKIRHFENASVADVKTDSKKNLIIVYTNGFLEVLSNRNNNIGFSTKKVQQLFRNQANDFSIFVDAADKYWLYVPTNPLTPNNPVGVIHIDPSSGELKTLTKENNILNNSLINGIVQDNQGNIWIGTDHGGINILDPVDFSRTIINHNPDNKSSIAQNSIYTLYKDDRGIIWAGTYKQGVSYYHERLQKFTLYTNHPSNPASLPFSDVNRFVEDANGNLWIGTNGGGLIHFDRQKNSFKQYRHSQTDDNTIGNDVIVSMFIDHENKLWIGSYFGGLDCFDGKKFKHYKNSSDPESLSDDRVWEIFEDSKHNLWVGTLTGGLNKLNRRTGKFTRYTAEMPNSIIYNYISALAEDQEGNLWIGTSEGLDVLNITTGKIIHYNTNNSKLCDNYIISIKRDHNNNLWIGTSNGLSVIDAATKNISSFNTKHGLPDKNILNIEEDTFNNIWVSTPKGLSNLSISEQNDSFSIYCQNYDELDGLQGRAFNENASLTTRSGEIVMGGANGFNIFDPARIIRNNSIPPVVLTSLQISNRIIVPGVVYNDNVILKQSLTESDQLVLKHTENDISIDFSALSYTNTEKNMYAYRLEGFNNDWIKTNAQNRRAVYTNLDAGEYTFWAKASNEDGLWNENGTSIKITILPPFWRTDLAYFFYFIAGALTLFLARRAVIQRARRHFAVEQERREAHRLHELDNMKIKFFTNVSHEFRTPLSLILSPLGKIIQQGNDPSVQKQLQVVHRNARRLLNLVNQLLDFRKLEDQELKLNTTRGDIMRVLKEICYSFNDLAEKKHINLRFESNYHTLITNFDSDKLERIIFNLLSNAFKFTPEHGVVSVEVAVNKKESIDILEIKIQDTGIGIEQDKLEKIFERFYQGEIPVSMLNQGSGIGLSITREFVKMMNGTINAISTPGNGSCFTVQIPFEKEIVEEDVLINTGTVKTIKPSGGILPTILLVEDNEDFRFYLKEIMQDHFHIIEASNGKSGWQKILSLHPDLVVSDITMPEMNGIDLCKKIKTDSRTKQIPVILLTALAGEEQQLHGLRTGVTDYLTKPFNVEILISRIQNILEHQKLLRNTYSRILDVKSTEIQADSPEEKFLQRVMEIVEKNISNADFSVEELSRELFMSRAATYKRIFTITGKPPTEFIRSIRLQRAAQLLTKTKMTVSEIAYEVGFNNPKYFTKYFKAEFNMVPSAYVAEKTT